MLPGVESGTSRLKVQEKPAFKDNPKNPFTRGDNSKIHSNYIPKLEQERVLNA